MKGELFSSIFKLYKIGLGLFTRRHRGKIFVYTDSRGFDVISKIGKTPFGSYINKLAFHYNVDYIICPQKFTTIIDFLEYYDLHDLKLYDYVIMHCGVVDFSPRPLSNIKRVKLSKRGNVSFEQLFEYNETHYQRPLGVKYNNEDVVTLYSKKYLQDYIGQRISRMKNLIWIDSNKFVKGWEGNFKKGRPSNIEQVVTSYEDIFKQYVKHRITLKDWTDDQIRVFTIDNIHFTPLGFEEVFRKIQKKLNELYQNTQIFN